MFVEVLEAFTEALATDSFDLLSIIPGYFDSFID
jgi:hypothetical protein